MGVTGTGAAVSNSKSSVTVVIDEQPITFRFTMLCLENFIDLQKQRLLAQGKEPVFGLAEFANVRFTESMRGLGDLFYAAAKADADINQKPFDYTPDHALEWIGEMTQADLNQVMRTFENSRMIKNLEGTEVK